MDCKKQDKELQQMCSQRLANERDLVERFKCHALKNGCGGIKTIGRSVGQMLGQTLGETLGETLEETLGEMLGET